jgi:rubrerythrin
MDVSKFKEIVEFAIKKEKEAVEFYQQCIMLTNRKEMKEIFSKMAEEEKRHQKMLENFKPESVDILKLKKIPNLKIGDYLVDMEFNPDMKYQELLILAMKREEKSYQLYRNFAEEEGSPDMTRLFQLLANEELKHKNRLEKEYDEIVYKDN